MAIDLLNRMNSVVAFLFKKFHTECMRSIVFGIVVAVGGFCNCLLAEDPPLNDYRHWSGLPLYAEEAYARGYELPLPFGVSGIYNYIRRDVDITGLRLGLNGGGLRDVSDYANLTSDTRVNVGLLRFDTWVMPFMNVYAIVGHVSNRSTTTIVVPKGAISDGFIPIPGEDKVLKVESELDGTVGGLGLTLAGGYGDYFLTVDGNYSATNMGFSDDFTAMILSARAGWHGTRLDLPVRAWLGVAYWDTYNTARSEVEIDGQTLVFEADQGPANPVNYTIGVSYAPHRNVDLFAEYGFNFKDLTFIAIGAGYRF